jgi:hypothetical protein
MKNQERSDLPFLLFSEAERLPFGSPWIPVAVVLEFGRGGDCRIGRSMLFGWRTI